MLLGGKRERVQNQQYPREGFDEFRGKLIAKKKKRIEILLGVVDLQSQEE